MTRETGILVDWHDARGFGFIQRPAGGKIYVHMKSIGKSVERPKAGDSLSYEIGQGSNGRPVAINVHNHGAPKAKAAPAVRSAPDPAPAPARPKADPGMLGISIRVAAAAVILVLLANDIMLGRFPPWVGLLYLIAGIASFLFYQADKRAAARREWREPERRLHLLDLTFGIIGGLLAQHVLRHKTYKPGFVMVTGLITALHVLTLGLIMFGVYAPGSVGDAFRQWFPSVGR
ncbi:MAG: DUF1294 domain-containing protein [Hyphomonadaceae bacterium]|nr:DUF1294 domain-containing protein [Hyphomonadaceae bacterium]